MITVQVTEKHKLHKGLHVHEQLVALCMDNTRIGPAVQIGTSIANVFQTKITTRRKCTFENKKPKSTKHEACA